MAQKRGATATPNPLAMPIASLSGVGEKTLEVLHKNGIVTIFDLLLRMPKSLVTQDKAPGFLHMESGRVYVAVGKVVATKLTGFQHKRRLEAILEDETGRLRTIFFGPAVTYAQQVLQKDHNVTVIGQVKEFLGRPQMVHPKLLTKMPERVDDTVATYSQLGGLTSAAFKRIVDRALAEVARLSADDYLSLERLATHNLSPLRYALNKAHNPDGALEHDWDHRAQSPTFRRVALEELISFYLRLMRERGEDRHKIAKAIAPVTVSMLAENFLPFSLTSAQLRVCNEIIADLSRPIAMTRLLQGDVGSGKTAVSAIAARHVAKSGYQIAVMAPTEILAEQLFKVYKNFFGDRASIALLTATVKGKERQLLANQIAQNNVAIVVGTHALLSEDIVFGNLALVIIDEQHRFGVKQRADLLDACMKRQGFFPHLLVMSATPIPRSLALTFYGDLDLSVIDERPKGRVPIHTQIITGSVLDAIGRCCARVIDTKQKAFVVFPLVEESEHLDLENATKAVAMLKKLFGEQSSLLLHGKMKPAEKVQAMEAFREGRISLLVATTVVEVGIDIPDATCMVIAHPERFGLAQLHQLRGRVGRKDLKSYCLLVSDITNKFSPAYKRLSAMCTTDNGFKLAEIDLEIRGPGELLGTKQSGLPSFLVFNHTDFGDLVDQAKQIARAIQEQGAQPHHMHLFGSTTAHFS